MTENAPLLVTREQPEPCTLKLKIEVPLPRVQAAFQEALDEFRRHARIPGFRPGKTPLEVLLRHHGKRLREEALQGLLRKSVDEALKQEKIAPETNPRIEEQDKLAFDENQALTFAIAFDLAPAFDVPAYVGIAVTRQPLAVLDEHVNSLISERLQRRATHEKVERPAQAGDMLKVSYRGELEEAGVVVPESAKLLLESDDVWFSMRPPEMIPGTIAALLGAEAGGQRRFQATMPDDFFEPAVAGKRINYTYTVHEVHQVQVPELTDELAKDFGSTSAAEVKARTKEYLTVMQKRSQEENLREQVLKTLMQIPDFPLPSRLVNRETYQAFSQLLEREFRAGKKESDIQTEQNALMEQARALARVQLKRHYILRAIAEAEKIRVTAEDVDAAVESVARYQRVSPKIAQRRLVDSGRISDLYDSVLESKALEFVISKAAITEAAGAPA